MRAVALACCLLMGGAIAARSAPVAGTIAVIPFVNRGGADVEWIGESIAEKTAEVLASAGLLVAQREDRLEVYRRLSLAVASRLTRASILKVAEELDAAIAICGDFEVTGSGSQRAIRIEAYAIDTRRMQKVFSWAEQGSLESLAVLQTRLAWYLLRQLAPEAAGSLEAFLARNKPVRLDAMENYIRGLLATSAEQRHRYLTQAARLDPNFSPPLFELGRMYYQRKEYRLAAGWLERVPAASLNYLQAQFMLGVCRYYLADFAGAEAAFQLLSRQVPLGEVINNLGAARSQQGKLREALDAFLKALEGDPADTEYRFNAGYVLWKLGQFEEAGEHLREVLERNPHDAEAKLLVARCLEHSGLRKGEVKLARLERLKYSFEERAWRELSRVSASLDP